MPAAASVTVVPASPRSSAGVSEIEPIAARPPVCSTNAQAARTFGPIEPAANSVAASASRGRAADRHAAPGCPSRRRRRRRRSTISERVGAQVLGEQRARQVLVDHRLDADEPAPGGHRLVGVHDRDAAAAGADDDAVVSSSHSTGSIPKIRCGSGEGTTRRKLSPSGLNTQPFSSASRVGFAPRRRSGPIGLVGSANAGSSPIDLDQRQQRGEALLERELVSELLLDQVADHPLGLGAEQVERIRARPPCRPSPAGRAGRPAARCRARSRARARARRARAPCTRRARWRAGSRP